MQATSKSTIESGSLSMNQTVIILNYENSKIAAYIEWAAQTTQDLYFLGCLTILPFGFVFNTLMILIFVRKKFSQTTIKLYYIVRI
mgnify:CR=1 FL=1